MEESLKCEYLDSELQPAWWQLNRCVQDPSLGLAYNCKSGEPDFYGSAEKPNLMNSLSIKRGHGVGIEEEGQSALASLEQGFSSLIGSVGSVAQEGFSNKNSNAFITDNGPGASSVPKGQCPSGYSRSESGECIQKCIGCKYRDNMKSQDFNEGDPCFPTGVFNGYTNDGVLKCTCGSDNKYCSDQFLGEIQESGFTTDGLYISGKTRQVGTVGFSDAIGSLFDFDQL